MTDTIARACEALPAITISLTGEQLGGVGFFLICALILGVAARALLSILRN